MTTFTMNNTVVVSVSSMVTSSTANTSIAVYPPQRWTESDETALWKELEANALSSEELLQIRDDLKSTGKASA